MLKTRTKILVSVIVVLAGAASAFGFLQWLGADLWPPACLKRQTQRRATLERVQKAGGWDALRAECTALTSHATSERKSIWPHKEPLPPIAASLGATWMEYEKGTDGIPIVYIHIYESHPSPPGHSEPLYGLLVICGPTPSGWTPRPWIDQLRSKRIADSIYEVHY